MGKKIALAGYGGWLILAIITIACKLTGCITMYTYETLALISVLFLMLGLLGVVIHQREKQRGK